nr:hypothetical protein [Rhodococcus sp. 06-1059B-a]
MNTPTPRPKSVPIADWATLIAKADALGLLSTTPDAAADHNESEHETCTPPPRTPR